MRVRRRAAGFSAAPLLVVIALSMQTGSALAGRLIASVGVVAALWMRTALGALMLGAVGGRWLRLPRPGERLPLLALTLSLFWMNLSFYAAISRAPLGVVVSVEFLGPLLVAVAGHRRPLDFLWILLAGSGVIVLAGPSSHVSPAGLAFSLLAAAGWAAFLLTGKRAVTTMEPLPLVTLMLAGSALVLTPLLLMVGTGPRPFSSGLRLGLTVALLSSALPYVLELFALSRVRAATYGVLLSIEPAVAALTGFAILHQRLSLPEVAAILAVVVAAAGASWAASPGPAETPAGRPLAPGG